jgi:anti-sigma factor RsiW
MASENLVCVELVGLVRAYLDDRLAEPRRRAVERHVAVCPRCSAHLERLRTAGRTLGGVGEAVVPPHVRDRAQALVRAWLREQRG